ncbi:hypothetical protein CYLTODRAFT_416635 [Cylindrobasidium torrendii FP15055 ss-10]|uniref:Uncharacterized protein n=1 Tax=Cylindrobasidium torrendii FP15055 ss-10 TaxID=1314674 RepID=A0A0D7BTX6_9AGAR|nr:hypothetical protein CYLTODRAFT_416635 [Cylindrobasidium torrendii FP15055 ss-10]
MSSRARFPLRRPADDPPPVEGQIVDGHRTPSYGLAWVCPPMELYENLRNEKYPRVSERNALDVVNHNWGGWPDFSYALHPRPYLSSDGNWYLVAMFNRRSADHIKRIQNLENDELVQSARVSFGIDKDTSGELEKTLQWFIYPVNWTVAERKYKERRAALLERERQEEQAAPANSQGASEIPAAGT